MDNTTQLLHFTIYQEPRQLRQHWKYLSIEFGLAYNTNMVQLFDNEYFYSRNCSTDQECAEALRNAIAEARRYPKAVLLFDLDQISGVRVDTSGCVTEDLLSQNAGKLGSDTKIVGYTIARPDTYQQLLVVLETQNTANVSAASTS